jgi:hypothetical protein
MTTFNAKYSDGRSVSVTATDREVGAAGDRKELRTQEGHALRWLARGTYADVRTGEILTSYDSRAV